MSPIRPAPPDSPRRSLGGAEAADGLPTCSTAIEPLIPPAKRGGRKREVVLREVVNGVMYVLSTGCQWRYIPKDLPPRSTVHDYLTRWNYDGTIEMIHHALYVQCREAIGREASPTACVIDSQSVKSVEKRLS